ncbi:hypothetical protein EBZ39_12465 [bacterium]|nr:hypothetical protein [bacterium]
MGQYPSITQQLLDDTQMRLVWANKEKTRVEIILWGYQSNTSRIRCYEFETYMRYIPRERIMTYFKHQDAFAFYREFYKLYDLYAETHPDMAWVDYVESIMDK